jgi:Ca-activated chloride channel family protein
MVSPRVDDAMVKRNSVGHKPILSGLGAQLSLVTLLAVLLLALMTWRNGSFVGLWLSADQQGQRAYDRLAFSTAADLFEDPMWMGAAAYDAGRYVEAAAAFGRIPTAIAFYNRGNAQMKSFDYAKAIKSYEMAVSQAPDWQQASDNLALARYVLDYIEGAREQSDTGKMGADDYKFDNTKKSGIDMEVTKESTIALASAEKWMRSVNTETGDFLRTRFALEAEQKGAP